MSPNIASTSGSVPQNVYAVDLNNDGVLDLVQDTLNQPNGFTVSIANGDGTFKAPVFHTVASSTNTGVTATYPTPIATGDFNNDGKVDVVVQISGSNQLEVFLGNGDGTFQAPKTVSVILPSGFYLTHSPIIASDFNQDGNVDLVVVTANNSNATTVDVLQGNGAGSFSSPHAVYTTAANRVIYNLVVGDFDGDGKPDIALTDTLVFQGSYFDTTLAVLYGNANFTFYNTTPYSTTGSQLTIGSGDLNGDGKTDLFGLMHSSQPQLAAFYAGTSRTFSSYFTTVPNPTTGGLVGMLPTELAPEVVMADFNGDQKMDLAVAEIDYSSGSNGVPRMLYALAGANPGDFTLQTSALQNLGSQQFYSNPVVADENHDGKPDIVINQAVSTTATTSSITTQLNGTSGGFWGNCSYPKTGNGIGICLPAALNNSSPVNFAASANSFGKLRKMEIWVDGQKVNEQHNAWEHNAWIAWSGAFSTGTHSATIFAADIDNRQAQAGFDFTVGGNCPTPQDYTVNVCAPVSSPAVSSPVKVSATAKIMGTLNRMEVWVDGVKKFTETTSLSLNATLSLAAGSHRFDIYAVNNSGTKYETTIYATVK